MMRSVPLVAAVLLALAGAAHAAPSIDEVIVVGRAAPDRPWTDAATEARAGDAAELAVIAIGRDGRRRVVLADPAIAPLALAGHRVAARDRRPLASLGDVEVRWSIVEPHGFRVTVAPNGASSPYYSNVSTEHDDFGRWLGYDHIDYYETPQGGWRDGASARRHAAEIVTAERDAVQVAGLGTTRYKAELRLPSGQIVASPGAESTDAFGVLPSVHRVSIRRGDDFLGWLSEYLLVPEVFGSAGGGRNHQTERFTGADCADVLVGALRRSGRTDVGYTSVAALTRYARVVAPPTDLDDRGMPAQPIEGVQRGDLVRINYGGELTGYTPRGWDHVAALWEDRSDPDGPFHGGPDGRLDGFDLVIHMGHPRLQIEPLSRQAPATVDVLRWRPGHRAR
ncbi:MAG TPA: hypothetical protein VHE35_12445 [Kofleriaceae bacterium]|nr:hypothetical protein [Kofleriaceae bacterium]